MCLAGMLAALSGLAIAGCVARPAMTIHSSSGPPISLWAMNEEIGRELAACGVGDAVEVLPSALPQSINEVGAWPERSSHFPMVTPVDFAPAVTGDGPTDWHEYPQPHPDLKFIASLYEVGFGVLVFDDAIQSVEDLRGKRIAVARRPSSLRVLAEALLRDGWGILDEVTLVDLPPHGVAQAVADGRVDATTWSLMIEEPGGYRPLDSVVLKLGDWLAVEAEDVARMNAQNSFTTGLVQIESTAGESVHLVSFDQGLAGWSSSADVQVEAILDCLSALGERDGRMTALSHWPGLNAEMLHPAALKYYREVDPNFLAETPP